MKKLLPDLLFIAGLAALTFGLFNVYEPLAYIVCGGIVMATGVRLSV